MRMTDWDGKPTPRLGFGCGSVMGRVGRRNSLRAIEVAWDAGIRLFDTARSYGYGEAEGLLGEFLVGRREEAIVVTKFGIWPQSEARWKRAAKPFVRAALQVVPSARSWVRRATAGEAVSGLFDVATLRRSFEASLRALRTEYVDALLAHEAPESVMAQDDLMAELEGLVVEGKVRRVGVSSTPEVVAAALRGPAMLSVFQFPANLSSEPRKITVESGRQIRMANHPFGGELRVKKAAAALRAMAADASVGSLLREKLCGDVKQRLAEVVFADVLRASEYTVPSMLHLDNLRADIAAVGSDRFTVQEVAKVKAVLYQGQI